MIEESQYIFRADQLDLPANLLSLLRSDIENGRYQQSNFGYTPSHHHSTTKSSIKRFFERLSFRRGYLRLHKLDAVTEEIILSHYKDFIDFVNSTYKLRYKVIGETSWVPLHSDVEISERVTGISGNGDRTSLFVIIQGNNEVTNWFSYPGKFDLSWFNPFKLKRQVSKQLEEGKCYLFNTEAIHSVSKCNPNRQRWILTICWNNISHEELCKRYKEFFKIK